MAGLVGLNPSPNLEYRHRVSNGTAKSHTLCPLSEYVGTFHSLFLGKTASSLSRKLCDYVGVAAVAWAKNDSIIVTH